jgi:diguanylate cyclase (GGDEF)-like protein
MDNSIEETINLCRLRRQVGDTVVVPHQTVACAVTPEACLVQIHPVGTGSGRRIPLAAAAEVIGRGSECTVVIADQSVSRRHARVEPGPDGGYAVADLGSTNGTFVNDGRVAAAPLADGDYLRIGNHMFRFLAGGNIEADYHAEIHRLAVLDPLTGLHNRRSLDEFLDREVERCRRHARPLAVVLLDIDHFKAINDTFGHLVGDDTLKDLARRVRESVRGDEFAARYGGEEFALVLPETGPELAAARAERLRRDVAERPFACGGSAFPVTISAGVGSLGGDRVASARELLQWADDRLYEAKRDGRNRVRPAARPDGRGPAPGSTD